MKDKIFFIGGGAFLLGVLWRSFLFVHFYSILLLLLLAMSLVFLFLLGSKNNVGILFSIFLIMFGVGMLRFGYSDKNPPAIFEAQAGLKKEFSGIIIDEPNIKDKSQQVVVRFELDHFYTKVLISLDLSDRLEYGDFLRIKGVLLKPQNFITDEGKEFDYTNYLRKDGIFYVMRYPEVETVSKNHGNVIKRFLYFSKNKFLEKTAKVIPEPESLLLGGLILGEKASFSQELRQQFLATGTIHIVALSGYNVTIVSEWFMKMFGFLPFFASLGAGAFAVLIFVVMTGASSTAVRAGIMSFLAILARATGRNYDVARALFLAGVVMVFLNPFILAYDVSFQLSFLATVGVIFFAPKIEKHFYWAPKRFGLRDVLAVTTATYLFVLPFVLYKMGNFSIVALPANFFILPFIPITMMLGFLTGMAGILLPPVSIPLGSLAYLFLHYELGVIKSLSALPFSAISISNFPLFITLLIYGAFIYFIFGKEIKDFFIPSL